MTVYASTSPYSNTSIVGNYLDIIEFRNIPLLSDDVLYTVDKKYHHRPDLLAFDLYEDPNLWWVFAVRNKNVIKDPIFDLTAGTRIFLPKKENIS